MDAKSTLKFIESMFSRAEEERLMCDNCSVAASELKERDLGPLQRCSRCKKTFYCSRACQIKQWKYHKTDCKLFRSPASIGDPNFDMLEQWKNDHKTNLHKIGVALLFPGDENEILAFDHIAVIQIRYTKGASVPFQIVDHRAIPDAALVNQEHGIYFPKGKKVTVAIGGHAGIDIYIGDCISQSLRILVPTIRQTRNRVNRNRLHNRGIDVGKYIPAIIMLIFTGLDNDTNAGIFFHNLCQMEDYSTRKDKSIATDIIVPLINYGFGDYNVEQKDSKGITCRTDRLSISDEEKSGFIHAISQMQGGEMQEGEDFMAMLRRLAADADADADAD